MIHNPFGRPVQAQIHLCPSQRLQSTPETLLLLVFAGQHCPAGIAAVNQALDDAMLGPHWAYVGIKRLIVRHFDTPPDLDAALKLLNQKIVLSRRELSNMMRWIETLANRKKLATLKKQVAMLKSLVAAFAPDDQLEALWRRLKG